MQPTATSCHSIPLTFPYSYQQFINYLLRIKYNLLVPASDPPLSSLSFAYFVGFVFP
jgi:hypothetical protein